MKKLVLGLIVILSAMLLTNCTSQPKATENLKREWMLVEFLDFNKQLLVSNRANINLTLQNKKGEFTAHMGCNNIFGKVRYHSDGTIKFSDVGSTMMFCAENMALESKFNNSLPTVTGFEVVGHFLTLSSADGTVMKFAASDWD